MKMEMKSRPHAEYDSVQTMEFSKYQAAGNDFVIIDNRDGKWSKFTEQKEFVQGLCDRRLGIGADGFVQLCDHPDFKFQMKFYNCDGLESVLCGNAMRCVVLFARDLDLLEDNRIQFLACDGQHVGYFDKPKNQIIIQMQPVSSVVRHDDFNFYAFSGAPHHVKVIADILNCDVIDDCRPIRYGPLYKDGANVNLVEIDGKMNIKVRTYERGVEGETLACGTGSVAAALVMEARRHCRKTNASSDEECFGFDQKDISDSEGLSNPMRSFGSGFMKHCQVACRGGTLKVSYRVKRDDNGEISFPEVFLAGPATLVFKGEYNIPNKFVNQ